MSSLPSEVLEDVLEPLDRWNLDNVQFTNRRFMQLVMERLSDVCLRHVDYASFRAPNETYNTDVTAYVGTHSRLEREMSSAHGDIAGVFSEYVQALRSSRVEILTINGLVFAPELAALVLQTPMLTEELILVESSCVQLTPAQFHKVLLHVSPTSLDMSTCQLRACQLTDELLRALSKNRVRRITCPFPVPTDGGRFAVTDDAIVDFCLQPDAQNSQEGDAPSELMMNNGNFTKELFKRLVEAPL
ncbi:hypothetical protein AAVH_09470 [Aphelenchoides avenae]|nr:hypothetical protein AAVH_09470 [Aphelenchus avenae]